MPGRKKKKYYALPCMIAILITALLMTAAGFLLRRTLLKGLPQYADAPDIAVPMMLLQDSGPLREARERAAWEARQTGHELTAAENAPAAQTPAPETASAAPEEPEKTAAPAPEETPVPPEDEVPDTVVTIGGEEVPSIEETEEEADEKPAEPEATPEPVWSDVDESYFDHTLFIGDSKTDEMRTWKRLGEAQYFCDTNFSVYNVFDKTASDPAFTNAKLDWVLKRFEFDQIYIMLGYNESGYDYANLMDQFEYVIRRVHDAQPQARIILHGVMHANASVSGMYYCYSVENLEHINDGLRALAQTYEDIYYVDCNEPFCDENGYLYDYVSMDGEHLLPMYSEQWAEEIRKRAITD